MKQRRRVLLLGGAEAYSRKLLKTGPDLYFIEGEAAGAVALDSSVYGDDGGYVGVTLGQTGIGDGNTAPLYDGINDLLNAFTPAFRARFNGQELSIGGWLHIPVLGVWTDGTTDRAVHFRVDAANEVLISKLPANDSLQCVYNAGGVGVNITITPVNPIIWFHLMMTASLTNNEMITYYNGAQVGLPQTPVGVWAGLLAVAITTLGAHNTGGGSHWNGLMAHWAIWGRALPPSTVQSLARV